MTSTSEIAGATHRISGEDAPVVLYRGGRLWGRFECGAILSIATLFAAAATLVMLVEAFSRGFLNHSYFWAEESSRYLMVWAFFLALGAAGRSGSHIRTEMLVNALGPRCRRLCNVLSSLAGVIFAVILLVASIPQILRYYTLGMMTESTLDLPMWALFLAMPVGAVLLAIYYVGSVVRALRGQDPFAPLPEAVIGRGGDAA